MGTVRRVVLVRHAERADENPGAAVSIDNFPAWDPPLTKIGVGQARRAALQVASKYTAPAIYTSPFLRCVQTAHPLGKHDQTQNHVVPLTPLALMYLPVER